MFENILEYYINNNKLIIEIYKPKINLFNKKNQFDKIIHTKYMNLFISINKTYINKLFIDISNLNYKIIKTNNTLFYKNCKIYKITKNDLLVDLRKEDFDILDIKIIFNIITFNWQIFLENLCVLSSNDSNLYNKMNKNKQEFTNIIISINDDHNKNAYFVSEQIELMLNKIDNQNI
jgi:hypothetical protein